MQEKEETPENNKKKEQISSPQSLNKNKQKSKSPKQEKQNNKKNNNNNNEKIKEAVDKRKNKNNQNQAKEIAKDATAAASKAASKEIAKGATKGAAKGAAKGLAKGATKGAAGAALGGVLGGALGSVAPGLGTAAGAKAGAKAGAQSTKGQTAKDVAKGTTKGAAEGAKKSLGKAQKAATKAAKEEAIKSAAKRATNKEARQETASIKDSVTSGVKQGAFENIPSKTKISQEKIEEITEKTKKTTQKASSKIKALSETTKTFVKKNVKMLVTILAAFLVVVLAVASAFIQTINNINDTSNGFIMSELDKRKCVDETTNNNQAYGSNSNGNIVSIINDNNVTRVTPEGGYGKETGKYLEYANNLNENIKDELLKIKVRGDKYDGMRLDNARAIISVGKGLKIPQRGWELALGMALQEADLLNLGSDRVPGSYNFPYDKKDSGDHDSVGIVQQLKGYAPIRDRQDVVKSIYMWYTGGQPEPNGFQTPGLLDYPNWEKMEFTKIIQATQRSAYPDHYAKHESLAIEIASALSSDRITPPILLREGQYFGTSNIKDAAATYTELKFRKPNAPATANVVRDLSSIVRQPDNSANQELFFRARNGDTEEVFNQKFPIIPNSSPKARFQDADIYKVYLKYLDSSLVPSNEEIEKWKKNTISATVGTETHKGDLNLSATSNNNANNINNDSSANIVNADENCKPNLGFYTSGNITGCDPNKKTYVDPKVKPWVEDMRQYIASCFPSVKSVGGYYAGSVATSDHPKGLASDVMYSKVGTMPTDKAISDGYLLTNWLIANHDALKIKYLIWQGKIWSPTHARKGDWRGYKHGSGNLNITTQHYDHVHISWVSGSGDPGLLSAPPGPIVSGPASPGTIMESAANGSIANLSGVVSVGGVALSSYMPGQDWISPLKKVYITSKFGMRFHPIRKTNKMHTGIDMRVITPQGLAAIHAISSGEVILASYNGGYGNFVVIDHGNGVISRYGHNSKLLVQKGQKVTAGTPIAIGGSTGSSTAPHLHFEIKVKGSFVNPADFLSKNGVKIENRAGYSYNFA